MPHVKSSGRRGLALMEEFGVTLIPALILLNGEGAVICRDGQEHLWPIPPEKTFRGLAQHCTCHEWDLT